MCLDLVLLVDVVEDDVEVRVDLLDRLVGSVHCEAIEVVLGHGAPVGHPTGQKDVINEKVRQLKEISKKIFPTTVCFIDLGKLN